MKINGVMVNKLLSPNLRNTFSFLFYFKLWFTNQSMLNFLSKNIRNNYKAGKIFFDLEQKVINNNCTLFPNFCNIFSFFLKLWYTNQSISSFFSKNIYNNYESVTIFFFKSNLLLHTFDTVRCPQRSFSLFTCWIL